MAERSLGASSSNLAGLLSGAAQLYQAEGRNVEAAGLLRRALQIDENTLAPSHPIVRSMLTNYAAVLRKLDRRKEAREVMSKLKMLASSEGSR
jgi:tetratricopeptide (TPR) repeat protein